MNQDQVKEQIEIILDRIAIAGEEAISPNLLRDIIKTLNFSYGAIDALDKELDIATENSYNYMEKYTWLSVHTSPEGVAISAGIPWHPIANPTSLRAISDRIDSYVEWGVASEKINSFYQGEHENESLKPQ